MTDTGKARSELRRLRRYSGGIGIVWTLIFAGLLFYEFFHERQRMQEMALTHARAMAERDLAWTHAFGRYLPPALWESSLDPTTVSSPSDHITKQEECVCLIRLDPSTGTHQAMDFSVLRGAAESPEGLPSPLHCSRAPDAWEDSSIQLLTPGDRRSVSEFLAVGEHTMLRYLTLIPSSPDASHRPFAAISLMVPTDTLFAEMRSHIAMHVAAYCILWMFGAGVLFIGHRRIRYRMEQRLLMDVALRESEARFERIATTESIGIWELDAGARTSFVNSRMASMLGYTVEEMLGKRVYDFMDDQERHQAERNFERRRQLLEDVHEFRFRRKDGTSLWTLIAAKPMTDEQGNFQGALGVITNIGEQKKLETQLRLSEERYRRLFETNVAGVYTSTTGGKILNCNDAFATMLGYGSASDLIGRDAGELYFSAGDREEFLGRVRAGTTLRTHQQLLRRRDQEKLWVVENVALLDGETLQGTMIDITRLRETLEALAESEERLRLLVESTDDVVAMLDLEGRFLYYNPVPRYGASAREVIGKTGHDLFGQEAGDRLLMRIREVVATGKPVEYANNIGWRGEQIWFQVRLYPLLDPRGVIRAVSLFARNITEQKVAEEKLRTTEESLHDEQLRTRIASDLHDDIGSTLSSTSIFSELLAKEVSPASSRVAQLLERISRNIREVQLGLHDIVWTISPENDSLDDLLLRLQEHAAEVLEGRGIAFRGRIPDTVDPLKIPMAVRRDVYLATKEGIHNVVKHADARSVTLDAGLEGDQLTIALTDDGVGFDAARMVEGNGLRSVRRRVESLGGSVSIDSQPGRGTRMVFRVRIA